MDTPTAPEHSPNEEIQNDGQHQALVDRLCSYSLVNNLFSNYQSLKETNAYIRVGLETAESTGASALAYSAPLVSVLDTKIGLDNKAHQLLDKCEEVTASATEYLVTAQRAVSETQEKVVSVATTVATTITAQKEELQSGQTFEKLFDYTESILDTFLPPAFEIEEVEHKEGSEETPKPTTTERVKDLGYTLPTRVKRFAELNVRSLRLRSPQEIQAFHYVVDLIQYATTYVDQEKILASVEQAKGGLQDKVAALTIEGQKLQTSVQDKVQENLVKLTPIRQTVEKYTSDVAHAGASACIGVVAVVAHAAEITRRQLLAPFAPSQNLNEELAGFVVSSKKAILSLNKEDLEAYIASTKIHVVETLSSVINLLIAYAPAAAVDPLKPTLYSWQQSIQARLAKPDDIYLVLETETPQEKTAQPETQ